MFPDLKVCFPTGIPNLGNTCYMNALMQSLSSCSRLGSYLTRCQNELPRDVQDAKSDILHAFMSFYMSLQEGFEEECEPFYSVLCEHFTNCFDQEDSHELLQMISTSIQECQQVALRKKNQLVPILEEVTVQDLGSSTCTSLMSTTHVGREELRGRQLFQLGFGLDHKLPFGELWMDGEPNPFAGIYEQRFQCESCKSQRWSKSEVKYDWTIGLSHQELVENMKETFNREYIEGYNCIKCSIEETLARLITARKRRQISMGSLEQTILIQEESMLSKYAEQSRIDIPQFEEDWDRFMTLNGASEYALPLVKTES
jgi:ubiquitin C-terminal hydrolase